MEEVPYSPPTCARCGYTLEEDESPTHCPNCGYNPNSAPLVEFGGSFPGPVSLRLLWKQPGYPKSPRLEVKARLKRSGKGMLAQETQVYDRMDPEHTVKRHQVREEQSDGSWATVHDHTDEYPAAHRAERESEEVRG